MSDSSPGPTGWVAQLVAALVRAVFTGWGPTFRIVLLLTTCVGLYVAARLLVP